MNIFSLYISDVDIQYLKLIYDVTEMGMKLDICLSVFFLNRVRKLSLSYLTYG